MAGGQGKGRKMPPRFCYGALITAVELKDYRICSNLTDTLIIPDVYTIFFSVLITRT